jgi:Pyruvate/2-oxoacid:ferredoxin oxidoreductase delta subunit
MPSFLLPWADRFFEPTDVQLIGALAERPRGVADLLAVLSHVTPADLSRAERRGIVDLIDGDEGPGVRLADFHARYEVWAIFEGWKDVPREVADRLNEWELDDYASRIATDLEALKRGETAGGEADLSYLLLEEAEQLVRQAEHVFLWPCDCRAMERHCGKPVNVCLRFENDRGLGWEISPERAVDVLREADRAGLMHTAYAGRKADDATAVCNCCTDCCYPHLAARRLGVSDIWPVRRHRARVDADRCTLCGRCAGRCPFGALTMLRAEAGPSPEGAAADQIVVAARADVRGRPRTLLFAGDECRGCGLCATGCAARAIDMVRVSASSGSGSPGRQTRIG